MKMRVVQALLIVVACVAIGGVQASPALCDATPALRLIPPFNGTLADGSIWTISLCKPININIKYCNWTSAYIAGWTPSGSCTGHFDGLESITVSKSGIQVLLSSYGLNIPITLTCGSSIGLTNVTYPGNPNLVFTAQTWMACL